MLLKEYKEKNNLTLNDMAIKFGVTGQNPRQTIRRWVEGLRVPRVHYSAKIEERTQGQVKFMDLVNGYKKRQSS